MKKHLLLMIAVVCTCTGIYAQDIIIKRNGDEISAKVAKVGSNEIEYKKWTNQDGPLYTINKSDVFMIKYINGEKDVFANEEKQQAPQQAANTTGPVFVKKQPAENNQQLIDRYKTPVKFVKMPKDKDADYSFPIMAMSDSSLVSTSDIEMKFVPTTVWYGGSFRFLRHSIELLNKTDRTIYIDLANTFRILSNGTSRNYYNAEQTTVNHGSSSGAGVNLGGIASAFGIGGVVGTLAGATTVGGSNQHTVSTTYSNQQILAIPPHSKKNLTEHKVVKVKGTEYKTISELEKFSFSMPSARGMLKRDGRIPYSEKESPYTAKYIITYSTSQDFAEYSSLHAKLYARYVYGARWYPAIGGSSQEKLIKNAQECFSNFWEDKGIIVGESTFIPKKKKKK